MMPPQISATLLDTSGTTLTNAELQPETGAPALSVVIPVYNERATIEEVICRVQAVAIEKEIIIVDDGSTDGTRQLLADLDRHINDQTTPFAFSGSDRPFRCDNISIFFQPQNRGKGAAVRRGFREACGDVVIVQDGDLELDPNDYGRLIEPIHEGLADVVYGSRFLGKSRQGVPLPSYIANKILTVASNVLTGLTLTDVWTGYKMFRREILQQIDLCEDRFGFEPEITAKVAKCACRVREVPVSYAVRSRDEGKKIGWKDGVRGIWCTLRYSILPGQRTNGGSS